MRSVLSAQCLVLSEGATHRNLLTKVMVACMHSQRPDEIPHCCRFLKFLNENMKEKISFNKLVNKL